MKYTTSSREETREIAQKLAHKYQGGTIIGLIGEMGAGKTTFAQGLASGLGIKQPILSPTFMLVRQYPIPKNSKGQLYHIDLYRLESLTDIQSLGITDILGNPYNIVLIEWAEKLGSLLPKQAIKINLSYVSKNQRTIQIAD